MAAKEIKEIKDLIAAMSVTAAAKRPSDDEIRAFERQQAEREKQRIYESRVPERYWHESLDTYRAESERQKAVLETCRNFVADVKMRRFRSLCLLGNRGTGKTHLGCGILRECGGVYRLSAQIVEEFERAKSFTEKNTEGELLAFYARAPLVVVDEVGRTDSPDKERHVLYQVVNALYNARGRLVIISNFKKKDFINYIGAATVDRLVESAVSEEFTWASHRKAMCGENFGSLAEQSGGKL